MLERALEGARLFTDGASSAALDSTALGQLLADYQQARQIGERLKLRHNPDIVDQLVDFKPFSKDEEFESWARDLTERLDRAAPAGVSWEIRAGSEGGVVISRHAQGVVQDTVLDRTFFNSPEYRHLAKVRSEEHTSELQSRGQLVCRLLLEKKKILAILI